MVLLNGEYHVLAKGQVNTNASFYISFQSYRYAPRTRLDGVDGDSPERPRLGGPVRNDAPSRPWMDLDRPCRVLKGPCRSFGSTIDSTVNSDGTAEPWFCVWGWSRMVK